MLFLHGTFPSSPSSAKKTCTAVYVRDHLPNGIWAVGIIRNRRGSVLYEMDVDGQSPPPTWGAATSTNLEMGSLDVIFNCGVGVGVVLVIKM
ncbi:hypothetical protein ACTXT7_014684 [Hymenolepis weldensis]